MQNCHGNLFIIVILLEPYLIMNLQSDLDNFVFVVNKIPVIVNDGFLSNLKP
jgi:hypothetical protein